MAAGDFDSDGYDDLAIGVDGVAINGQENAGAVSLLYGSDLGLVVKNIDFFHQDVPTVEGVAEENDSFGNALAVGYFNKDDYADLVIGVVGEDVETINAAGAVNILYGSTNGLTAAGDQIFQQDSVSGTEAIAGAAEAGDWFGAAVATGDFNGDGHDDLAVGAIGERVGPEGYDEGAINIIYGSSGGLTFVGNHIFSQSTTDVLGTAMSGDEFGYALATGNFNGDAYDDLVVGITREGVKEIVDQAGALQIFYGSAEGIRFTNDQLFNKELPGVAGTADANHFLGDSVAVGDFNGDGHDDVVATDYQQEPEADDRSEILILYAYAQAQVQVLPAELPFVAVAGQRNPDAKSFQLSNGTGSRGMVWDAQIDVPWITLAYSHSTAVPLLVQVTVDTTGLPASLKPYIDKLPLPDVSPPIPPPLLWSRCS